MSAGRGQVRLARAGRVGADFSEARPCQTPACAANMNPIQQDLPLPLWGGARRGAGRKRKSLRKDVPHVARRKFRRGTLHVAEAEWWMLPVGIGRARIRAQPDSFAHRLSLRRGQLGDHPHLRHSLRRRERGGPDGRPGRVRRSHHLLARFHRCLELPGEVRVVGGDVEDVVQTRPAAPRVSPIRPMAFLKPVA